MFPFFIAGNYKVCNFKCETLNTLQQMVKYNQSSFSIQPGYKLKNSFNLNRLLELIGIKDVIETYFKMIKFTSLQIYCNSINYRIKIQIFCTRTWYKYKPVKRQVFPFKSSLVLRSTIFDISFTCSFLFITSSIRSIIKRSNRDVLVE